MNMFEYSGAEAEQLVSYIYDHYDVFKLLVECSEGTEFSDFLNQLVEVEMEYTVKYMDCTGHAGYFVLANHSEIKNIMQEINISNQEFFR